MKICIIASLYDPYLKGGAETAIKNLANSYTNNGDDVIVITTGPYTGLKSLLANKEINNKIVIYRFYPLNIFWLWDIDKKHFIKRILWRLIDMFNIYSCLIVKHILNIEKPDIILTHNINGISSLIPLLLKASQQEHIHTVHDIQLVIPSGILLVGEKNYIKHNNIFIQLYRLFINFCFSFTKTVVFPSQWLLNFYTKHGFFKHANKIVINNQNVVLPKHDTDAKKDNNIFNIAYVGQIENHKGIFLLTEAFIKMCFNNQNKNIQLHIVGNGSEMYRLTDMIKDYKNIIIHGRKENQEVMKLLTKMHLCVVPSLCYENAPMIIFESMNVGTPILASRIGGIPELIKNYEKNSLFEPNNQEDLIKKMQYCFDTWKKS